MRISPEGETHTPPRLALRLLEIVLRRSFAENIIGDLEEEYHVKRKHIGHRTAAWYFWIQSLSVLKTSVKELSARPSLLFTNMHLGAITFGMLLGCLLTLPLTSLLLSQRNSVVTVPLKERGGLPLSAPSPVIVSQSAESMYETSPVSYSNVTPHSVSSSKMALRPSGFTQRRALASEQQILLHVSTSMRGDEKLEGQLVKAVIAALEKTRRFKVSTTTEEVGAQSNAYKINFEIRKSPSSDGTVYVTLSSDNGVMWDSAVDYEGRQGTFLRSASSAMADDITHILTKAKNQSSYSFE